MRDALWVQAMMELRRSSATTPVKSGKQYKRKVRTPKQDQDKN